MPLTVGKMVSSSQRVNARSELARRFAGSVECCRQTFDLRFDDEALSEATIRIEQGLPGPADAIVARCQDGLTALAQQTGGGPDGRVSPVLFDLLTELHVIGKDLTSMRLQRHSDQMGGMRAALHQLRNAEASAQMIERAVRELCASCGFDRCAAFRMDDTGLVVQSAFFTGQEEWAERWQNFSELNPARLQPQDIEVEMIRRQVPILADRPQRTARGMAEIVRSAETESYVAAPIVSNGKVVGTLHADNLFSGRPLDVTDRDALGVFAEGLAFALERTVLLQGVRAERERMRQLMGSAEAGFEALTNGGIEFKASAAGEVVATQQTPAALPQLSAKSHLASLLTAREVEVLQLMAEGATNAQIADRLVVSNATVKSHVKHIMRKLRASNRAEAVAKYYRLAGAGA